MTTPRSRDLPPVDRLTFSGTYGTGQNPVEIWSWSLAFEPISSTLSLADRAKACHDQWVTTIAPMQPDYVTLTRTRVASTVQGGKVATDTNGAFVQGDDVRSASGTKTGTAVMPLQVALVVSLDTAQHGATGKGRVFLPWIGATLDGSSFALGTNAMDDVLSRMGTFIEAVNGVQTTAGAGILGRCVVASTKGGRHAVTSIRVGAVPDTMRSRRNALVEGYRQRAISTTALVGG